MTTAILTQAFVKQILDYNPESGVFYWRVRRKNYVVIGDIAGQKNIKSNYWQLTINGNSYQAHRVAWLYMTGEWPSDQIDHKDHVRHNNRWSNLRLVSNATNARNRSLCKLNTSNACGVNWHKKSNKWRAYIRRNEVNEHLGYFIDWFEAVCARKSAEARYGYHPNHGRARG